MFKARPTIEGDTRSVLGFTLGTPWRDLVEHMHKHCSCDMLMCSHVPPENTAALVSAAVSLLHVCVPLAVKPWSQWTRAGSQQEGMTNPSAVHGGVIPVMTCGKSARTYGKSLPVVHGLACGRY